MIIISALRNLKLHILPDAWRLFAMRKVDANFAPISRRVWERDRYTCQFCGFQALQHQEVVNLDLNYRNNNLNNLITSCCFCSQCFFLEAVGKDDASGGSLIYLPEITQGELNGLCHVLFCAMANATNYRTDAQSIYRDLKLRAQIIENKLGEGMSDPAMLGQMLVDAPMRERKSLEQKILSSLRLLPNQARFNKQIEEWAEAALNELSSNKK